jgi:hypothetical protein
MNVLSTKQANESTWKTSSNQSESGLLRKGEFTGRRWKVDDRSTESWIQGRSDGEVIFSDDAATTKIRDILGQGRVQSFSPLL